MTVAASVASDASERNTREATPHRHKVAGGRRGAMETSRRRAPTLASSPHRIGTRTARRKTTPRTRCTSRRTAVARSQPARTPSVPSVPISSTLIARPSRLARSTSVAKASACTSVRSSPVLSVSSCAFSHRWSKRAASVAAAFSDSSNSVQRQSTRAACNCVGSSAVSPCEAIAGAKGGIATGGIGAVTSGCDNGDERALASFASLACISSACSKSSPYSAPFSSSPATAIAKGAASGAPGAA